MGQSSAETVEEIENIRDRLDGEVRALEDHLPAPAVWAKRLVGVAVGGGAAGSAFWFVTRRIRSARASTAPSEPVQSVIQLLPDGMADDLSRRVTEVMEDGSWRPWAAMAAGAWMLFRMAELRQLRRMNSALIGARR